MRVLMRGSGGGRGRRAMAAGLLTAMVGSFVACGGSPTDSAGFESTVQETRTDLPPVFGGLTGSLELTGDQASAVREVLETYRGQVGEPGSLWYAASELQGILRSDQIEALEAPTWRMRPDAGARRSGASRRRGGRAEAAPRRPAGPVDLSDEQLARLKQVRESFAPEMTEIREGLRDGSLTREEAGERLESIREAIHDAMRDILTPDQLALLEEHRAEAEARRAEREDQREEQRQAAQVARAAALELTDAQVVALEALEERVGFEGWPSPDSVEARRREHQQALFDILDDRQQEIWILHASMSRSLARRRGRGG